MGVDGVCRSGLWIDLERKMSWLSTKPYLIDPQDSDATSRTLEENGFRVVSAQAPDSGVLEEARLVELTEKLGFVEDGAGSWAAFNDRLWDLLTSQDEMPVAIVIEDADRLLRAELHSFVRCVHKLLSMTEAVGLSDDRANLQVEYFFVGDWKA